MSVAKNSRHYVNAHKYVAYWNRVK